MELAKEQIRIAFEQSEKEVTDLSIRTKQGLITAKQKGINVRLKNIMKAIEAGIFNETVQEKMLELEQQRKFQEEELKALQNRRKYELKLEDVVRFLNSFVGNLDDAEVRKKVLEMFVNKMYLYNDKLVITFNFTEDVRELPFEEIPKMLELEQRLESLMDDHELTGNASKELLESLIGKNTGGDGSDFFSVRCSNTCESFP